MCALELRACLNERANRLTQFHSAAIYATTTRPDGRQRNLRPQPSASALVVDMADQPTAAIRPYRKGDDEDNRLARFYIGMANTEGLAVANRKGTQHATWSSSSTDVSDVSLQPTTTRWS